jgi:hypothetical protein
MQHIQIITVRSGTRAILDLSVLFLLLKLVDTELEQCSSSSNLDTEAVKLEQCSSSSNLDTEAVKLEQCSSSSSLDTELVRLEDTELALLQEQVVRMAAVDTSSIILVVFCVCMSTRVCVCVYIRPSLYVVLCVVVVVFAHRVLS